MNDFRKRRGKLSYLFCLNYQVILDLRTPEPAFGMTLGGWRRLTPELNAASYFLTSLSFQVGRGVSEKTLR